MWSKIKESLQLRERSVTDETLKLLLLENMGKNDIDRRDVKVTSNVKFRASGLGGLCARKYALALIMGGTLDGKAIDAKTSWIFGIGTAFHYQFQNGYLRSLGNDVLKGHWRCKNCGKIYRGKETTDPSINLTHGWITAPKSCECEGTDFEYYELEFNHEIGGHCDGIIDVGFGDEILELKTINSLAYVDPSLGGNAKIEHVKQVQLYMYFSGLKRARIVYVEKGENDFKKAIVEHIVLFDQSIVDEIFEQVINVQSLLATIALEESYDPEQTFENTAKSMRTIPVELINLLPPRCAECTSKNDFKVKYCSRKKECFTL